MSIPGALAVVLATGAVAWAGPKEDFPRRIQPLLKKYCYDCHNDKKHKGDLNLVQFKQYEKVTAKAEVFQDVLERVQAYEMPPKKAPQPNYGERQRLRNWLRSLPKSSIDCNKLATDRTQSFYRGYVMSRRLNAHEYNNTIRDLIGMDLRPGDRFPTDGAGGEGFDNNGDALFTSPILMEKYLDAAEQVVKAALPDTSGGLTPPVAAARKRILIATPSLSLKPRDAARKILATFARRAFRRPVEAEEINKLLKLFDHAQTRGDSFVGSVRLAAKGVLVSPHFLFLVESGPTQGGVYKLAPLPLASRLSYFLWSSMPDEQLLKLAESGKLADPKVYRHQVRRMLADPKAKALGEQFAVQWLDMRPLGGEIRPDKVKFPQFDNNLSASMRAELVTYFNHIVQNNRSLLELLDSDYTFVDERLAGLYGIPSIKGTRLRRVTLKDRNRGGVLGMAGIHALTSYPLRTSPVLRGKWVLEALLGSRVPPPPPDVPALEETPKNADHATLRKRLEVHRTKAKCAQCHDRMDPLGFGLENFDVLGRWRTTDGGQPIDSSGKLPSGERFSNPTELKAVLLKRKDQVVKHLVKKMVGYAYGRGLNKFDNCVINDTHKALKANGYRAAVMIESIATSYPFLHRFAKKE